MPINEAAPQGDLFVTVTGDLGVIGPRQIRRLKDGAIICNSGHFDVEIDIAALKALSRRTRVVRQACTEHELKDGRHIYLLAEGRLVNLAAAEGHPALVMDLSFSNQALACEYLKKNAGKLTPKVYRLPQELDEELARLKLHSMGIRIDSLTTRQRDYLTTWRAGT
jgi:adenosylhomocysteinase